jgi:hypothetical protein
VEVIAVFYKRQADESSSSNELSVTEKVARPSWRRESEHPSTAKIATHHGTGAITQRNP